MANWKRKGNKPKSFTDAELAAAHARLRSWPAVAEELGLAYPSLRVAVTTRKIPFSPGTLGPRSKRVAASIAGGIQQQLQALDARHEEKRAALLALAQDELLALQSILRES